MIAAVESIAALGDIRRREIFEILASGPRPVGELARQLPVTRSAVSQHLLVLQKAGLVTHRVAGTRHLYQLDPQGIAGIREYLDSMWQKALDNFKAEAERAFAEHSTNEKD